MNRITSFILLAAISISSAGHAQEEIEILRPVNSVYTLEAGSSHVTDTYLSPIKYTGWHLGLKY